LLQATVGEADYAVAGGLEGGVAGAVALEGGAVVVEGEAVELDDQAVAGPEDVDLEAEKGGVYGRHREAVLAAEGDEPVLERGAGRAGAGFGKQAADRAQGVPSPASLDNLLQIPHLEQPEAIGLLPGATQPRKADDFRKVEEGAGDGRHGNPVTDGPFAIVKASAVESNPTASRSELAARGSGYVDDRASWVDEAPQGRGTLVA
jgi:hypothetical protein